MALFKSFLQPLTFSPQLGPIQVWSLLYPSRQEKHYGVQLLDFPININIFHAYYCVE